MGTGTPVPVPVLAVTPDTKKHRTKLHSERDIILDLLTVPDL